MDDERLILFICLEADEPASAKKLVLVNNKGKRRRIFDLHQGLCSAACFIFMHGEQRGADEETKKSSS